MKITPYNNSVFGLTIHTSTDDPTKTKNSESLLSMCVRLYTDIYVRIHVLCTCVDVRGCLCSYIYKDLRVTMEAKDRYWSVKKERKGKRYKHSGKKVPLLRPRVIVVL